MSVREAVAIVCMLGGIAFVFAAVYHACQKKYD
jgi:hypothetical protein